MQDKITFLILAGGRGQRMNSVDKGLMQWKEKTLIAHVLDQLDVDPDKIIISANRNIESYEQYTKNVVRDNFEDFQGPLAGILSAMQICETPFLVCLPCDSPLPPENMPQLLWQCMQTQNKTAALCHDGERLQPLFSLISCQHKPLLNDFLQQGRRKVHDFMQLIDPAICDFSMQKSHFNNFNRPEDMNL